MSDLTAEAIEKIQELAVQASGAESFTMNFETGRARVFDTKTGTLTWIPIPHLPPNISVRDIKDLELAFSEYGVPQEATVWVCEMGVALLFDEKRLGKAFMPLTMNPAIRVLKEMRDKTPQQLRRILRIDLFGCKMDPEDFTNVVSALKFESTQATDVKLAKGDESIGKSIRSKVTAESEIPDMVSFEFDVFPDLSVESKVQIKCAVITEPTAGTVSVIPYPGELESAVNTCLDHIAEELSEKSDWTVFRGTCV